MLRKCLSTFTLVMGLVLTLTFALPVITANAGNNGYTQKRSYQVRQYKPKRHYKAKKHHRYNRYPRKVYYSGRPKPWTRSWHRYCHNKYRSFNSRTGYFTTYSGKKRFCR